MGFQLLRVVSRQRSGVRRLSQISQNLLLSHSYRGQPNLLYRNEGDKTFKDVSVETGVGNLLARGWELPFHFNNDGYPDVFCSPRQRPQPVVSQHSERSI